MNTFIQSLDSLERLLFQQLSDRVIYMTDEVIESANDSHAWSHLIMLAHMAGIPPSDVASAVRGLKVGRVNDWKAGNNNLADLYARKVVEYLRSRALQGRAG